MNGANVPELMKKLKTHCPVAGSETTGPQVASVNVLSLSARCHTLSLSVDGLRSNVGRKCKLSTQPVL